MSLWSPNGADPPCPECGVEGCLCSTGEEPTPGEHLGLVLAARARRLDVADDGDSDEIDF